LFAFMRIAIDAMGGDHAPREIVLGAVEAARKLDGISIILVGDESAIRPFLPDPVPANISLYPATQVVEMDESPATALRAKKDSGLAVAVRLHAEGQADACLSAGNTGATSAFALFTLGRIEGVDRPGIATVFPTRKNPLILMDGGANVDCKPRHLADFAVMGAAYVPAIRNIIPNQQFSGDKNRKPTVGVLSIGEEEAKGNELSKAAFPLVKGSATRGGYEFFGNVEGRDIAKGTVDVIVCDGFVGNVVLKMAEGFAYFFMDAMKEALTSSFRSKIGAILVKPALTAMKRRMDHTEYGGAALLGVNGTCIICHGSAKSNAIASAIRVAKLAYEAKVPDNIRAALQQAPTE
jgi:glycerol-3-phosphate acyltransferase PlsX